MHVSRSVGPSPSPPLLNEYVLQSTLLRKEECLVSSGQIRFVRRRMNDNVTKLSVSSDRKWKGSWTWFASGNLFSDKATRTSVSKTYRLNQISVKWTVSPSWQLKSMSLLMQIKVLTIKLSMCLLFCSHSSSRAQLKSMSLLMQITVLTSYVSFYNI